jgi:hypothetical protein
VINVRYVVVPGSRCRLCDGDVLFPSTTSGLKAIGLVDCRRDARAVRVVSCTGVHGSRPRKTGFQRTKF